MMKQEHLNNIFSTYYETVEFPFEPLFPTSPEEMEWGYKTTGSQLYRHLPLHDFDDSSQELLDNHAIELYHSISNYTNPTKTNYPEKDPESSRIVVIFNLNSTFDEGWSSFLETVENTKTTLEREFPFDFTVYRTGAKEISLISGKLTEGDISTLTSRLSGYINPHKRELLDIENLDASSSVLHRSIYRAVRENYVEIYNQLHESDSEEDLQNKKEEIKKELSDNLYNVGEKKSGRIIKHLLEEIDSENEIDLDLLVNKTLGFQTATEQYAIQYLSENWLGDRDTTSISVGSPHYMVPSKDSLVYNGGFNPYEITQIESENIYPRDHFPSFDEDTLTITLTEDVDDSILDELNLDNNTPEQSVSEAEGVFLLSLGLATYN